MTQDEMEKMVIEKCLQGDDPYLIQLRGQIPYIRLLRRRRDEAGFMSEYQVPDDRKTGNLKGLIDDVGSTYKNQTILFKLYISDGKIDALEGYAIPYGWPENYNDLDELTYAFQDDTRRYKPLGNGN